MTDLENAAASRVQSYYDETWFDYRVFWLSPQNRAVHFGYWDEHTLYRGESLLNMNRQLAARAKLRAGARDQWRPLQRSLWFEGIFIAQKPTL